LAENVTEKSGKRFWGLTIWLKKEDVSDVAKIIPEKWLVKCLGEKTLFLLK